MRYAGKIAVAAALLVGACSSDSKGDAGAGDAGGGLEVHMDDCAADGSGGVDVSDPGGCTPPTGTFACGGSFCMHGTEYCSRLLSPSSPEPGTFQCRSLPGQCSGTPSCACVPGTFGYTCTCATSADGDFTSTCTAP